MSEEHASMRIIEGYARGGTDLAVDEVWAVEAHLGACRVCRDRLSAAVGAEVPAVASLVDTVWSGLEPQLAITATMPRGRHWSARLSRWLTPTMVPWLAMVVGVTLSVLRSLVAHAPRYTKQVREDAGGDGSKDPGNRPKHGHQRVGQRVGQADAVGPGFRGCDQKGDCRPRRRPFLAQTKSRRQHAARAQR